MDETQQRDDDAAATACLAGLLDGFDAEPPPDDVTPENPFASWSE